MDPCGIPHDVLHFADNTSFTTTIYLDMIRTIHFQFHQYHSVLVSLTIF